MKSIRFLTVPAISSLVAGRAQQPSQGAESYVSPSTYDGRSRENLLEERNEIVRRVNQLTNEQKEAAATDAVLTGIALIVFWPAAIGLATTRDNATVLSAAKGNCDAIATTMT